MPRNAHLDDDNEDDDTPPKKGLKAAIAERMNTTSAKTAGLLGGLIMFVVLALAGIIAVTKARKEAERAPAADPAVAAPAVPNGNVADKRVSDNLLAGAGTLVALAGVVLAAAYVVVFFGMGAWVARDAESRGMSGLGWAVFYFAFQIGLRLALWFAFGAIWSVLGFLSLLCEPAYWMGAVVYLFARRPGRLVRCDTCDLHRLNYDATCPHCGHT